MKRSHGLMVLAIAQALAGASIVWRLLRTAGGEKIATCDASRRDDRVSILVPVLNERHRLGSCLQGLIAQPEEVTEILVVDGGSDDGTRELASCYNRVDRRVRVVDAAPIPQHWNGKAHGLQVGLEHADPDANWVLTIDADVRVQPDLVRSLLAHAARVEATMVSVATRQRLSGAREGLVHPAMLTTLVYRLGIPGQTTRRMADVQANGQCCLVRREPLEHLGGFAPARGSVCEDVTVARALAKAGLGVGLYESDTLAEVAMYENWREAWRNWTRSLPMRDRYSGVAGWRGLAEVAMAQALPLPLLLLLRWRPVSRPLLAVNVALALVRLGTLAGTARAYPERPWTYWLSPLLDLPVTVRIWQSAFRRAHVWRGRVLIRDDARTRITK